MSVLESLGDNMDDFSLLGLTETKYTQMQHVHFKGILL